MTTLLFPENWLDRVEQSAIERFLAECGGARRSPLAWAVQTYAVEASELCWQKAYPLLDLAFPPEERRGEEDQIALAEDPDHLLILLLRDGEPEAEADRAAYADERNAQALWAQPQHGEQAPSEGIACSGEVLGLLSLFDLQHDHWFFVEHLAIAPEGRGQGWGSALLRALQSWAQGRQIRLLLELEPLEACLNLPSALATSPQAEREARLRFYQRLGFQLLPEPWIQPPYQADREPVELRLMSWPEAVEGQALASLRQRLARRIYRVEKAYDPSLINKADLSVL